MVSIYWVAPDSGMAPIETYIYFLYKTFKRNEGVKIGLVPFPKCRNCFHVLDGLEPNETYSVGIRAYNSLDGKGSLSKMSNIETFKLKKGEMIVFPSHTWHKVNKVTKGIRKTLVGWVVGSQWK